MSVLETLTQELERGRTLAQAGRLVGLSVSQVFRLVKDQPIDRLRRRPLTDRERRLIAHALRTTALSRRAIGLQFGRGASTVQRIAETLRRQPGVRVLRVPMRCPGCGRLLIQWPCLACEIEGRRGAESRN